MTRCRKDNQVWLYVYDLSAGATSVVDVSPVYHTSIVVNEKEIAFGPDGVTAVLADTSHLPLTKMHLLGDLEIEMDMFMKYLSFLNTTKFKEENYNVMNHNCNNFTRFIAKEILHCDIPAYLHDVPTKVTTDVLTSFYNISNILFNSFKKTKKQ